MRLPVFLILVFLMIASAFGCGERQAARKPEPPVKIAVSLADMERDGNKIIKKVIESRKKKDNVDITWLDAGNDQARQEQQLEKLGRQKVGAVVLQPVNPVTGPDLMRRLVEKNIKVVALEILPEDVPVDAYVAPDHALAGQLLARFAVRSARKAAGLPVSPDSADYRSGQVQGGQQGQGGGRGQGGGGSQGQSGGGGGQTSGGVPPEIQAAGGFPLGVVLISGDPGDRAAREMAAAARAALQAGPEVRLLAEEAVPKGDPSLVPQILQRVFAEKGNSVRAVLATDSRLAMAAVEMLKEAGLNSRVLTAGVGADEKASTALASGEHDAEVDTRPDLLGQYALDAAIDLAKNGRWQYSGQAASGSYSVPSRITPVRLIESGNVYLLEQRWGGLKGKAKGQGGGQGGGGGGQGGSGDGGGKQGQDRKSGSGEQGGGGQGGKTVLRITTQDGKTMEVQIDGKVKKIESVDGQGRGGQDEGGQGGAR
ncbi:MAG: substrate-binding domain-containing protein [Peptococcaceae bacterium]|nr:substrate-binding domain-containing protein [Peptococcaceae bacterium]